MKRSLKSGGTRRCYAWVISAMSVVTVMGALGFARFGYTMILPSMKDGLGLNDAGAGDLASGNLAGYLVLALACGFLASRFSPRKIITAFMLLVAASMAVTGLAVDFSTALAGRVLAGMGGGGTNIPVMGIVVAWFSQKRRGLATGIAVSGSSVGLVVTGLTVPAVLDAFGAEGWRQAWYILALMTLAVAVLCAIFLRDTPAEMGLSPVGDTPAGEVPPGAAGLAHTWRLVAKHPAVWHLSAIYILFGFSYIIYATFFIRYLHGEGGFTMKSAGALWSLVGAASVASGFIWGHFSDRAGRKFGLAAVFALQAASYAVFGLWKCDTGYFVSAGMFALTAWSIPAIMAAASGDLLGPGLATSALGFITLFFGIGQVLGPFAAGRMADAAGTYTPAFIAAGAASALGAALSLALKMGGQGNNPGGA